MAIYMKDSVKILRRIQSKLRGTPKTTLEVNGNSGPAIKFEELQYEDNMMGDQLFGHPSMKEIEKNLKK